jgi:membrane associated rhomboid family serine protease
LLPLKDLNEPSTTPHLNRLLLILNIIVFAVYWLSANGVLLNTRFESEIVSNFVMYPYEIAHGQRLYTVLTSMFMHAGWIHLLGNMLFLFVFGDNVEDAFGHVGYLLFYIVCGVAAAYTHILTITTGFAGASSLTEGVVGASGAISGVLGAYAVLYPKAKIVTFVFCFLVPLPAIVFLGFWFTMQWFYGIFDISGNIAYWAHIGGFIMGIALALIFGLGGKKAREARLRL